MAPGAQRLANVLAELMARRGYGRVQSTEAYETAWRQAAGSLAVQYTRVGQLRRGSLEILVSNSTLMQELTFQKAALVKKLAELLPEEGIRSLRFRVGAIA
jgi:predicted nucleic acid-binding Zn ribbon protein